jgi:hypothetical protein
MEAYGLEEVMSGVEESCLWVTLGFSSQLEENDVLHVVCATAVDAEDRNGGMADLYLERFDQAYSCYSGAESILVAPSSVEVRLNDKGCEALDFVGGGVSFTVPAGLEGYMQAVEILRRMTALECGKRIRVDVAG